jgi:hypothetical protein
MGRIPSPQTAVRFLTFRLPSGGTDPSLTLEGRSQSPRTRPLSARTRVQPRPFGAAPEAAAERLPGCRFGGGSPRPSEAMGPRVEPNTMTPGRCSRAPGPAGILSRPPSPPLRDAREWSEAMSAARWCPAFA